MTMLAARHRADGAGRWPMTIEARAAVEAEIASLTSEIRQTARDAATHGLIRLPDPGIHERIARLEQVLAEVTVVTDPAVAAIGRRVRVESEGDAMLEVALVLPGEGDILRGWVSADAPLGAAILGARVGDEVTVNAPSRAWTARLVGVE